MKTLIILSLLGDYSGIGRRLEKELAGQEEKETEIVRLENLTKEQLQSLCGESLTENETLKEQDKLLREELNELYLKYDQMAAAYGEMTCLVNEAASVPFRHFEEAKDGHR